ncbi:TrmO family methyltransferase [Streptomyces sp. NPDC048416]|uniref:TrmO family methyltransferase domain-containing protein n=1 Tax=Streptomyces sp. NPDC048416 TaxID=3365546 RepID=UPI00371A3C95
MLEGEAVVLEGEAVVLEEDCAERALPVVESRPVASVVAGRDDLRERGWGEETALLRLDGTRFGPEALAGLEQFSHLEVVFFFDRVPEGDIDSGARQIPGHEPGAMAGIFAQRSRRRPNRLGVSRCRLVAVDGLDLRVTGLDAVAGTPVLDIKPWVEEFGPLGEVRQPTWATTLMRGYY